MSAHCRTHSVSFSLPVVAVILWIAPLKVPEAVGRWGSAGRVEYGGHGVVNHSASGGEPARADECVGGQLRCGVGHQEPPQAGQCGFVRKRVEEFAGDAEPPAVRDDRDDQRSVVDADVTERRNADERAFGLVGAQGQLDVLGPASPSRARNV